MARILILCPFPYGQAAGQRLKYEQYINNWRNNGHSVDISPFMTQKMWKIVYKEKHYIRKVFGTLAGYKKRIADLFKISKYDIVYVFMWVTPIGPPLFESLVRLLARRVIYDIEDNIIVERYNTVNPIVKLLRGSGKALYLIKNSDHIITSSAYLNDFCLKYNAYGKCTYISSSIDTNVFIPANTYSNSNKVVIGWTGTFTSIRYLDLLRDVFIKLSKIREFKLRVIGNFEYDIPGVDLEVIQWSKKDEVKDLQGVDIGVYPLEINKWVLGKSGLKVIQYMAFGIPSVSTNVGSASDIIQHMKNGILVDTKEEWINSLKLLIDEAPLRMRLGVEARHSVLNNYSKNVIKSRYLKIIDLI